VCGANSVARSGAAVSRGSPAWFGHCLGIGIGACIFVLGCGGSARDTKTRAAQSAAPGAEGGALDDIDSPAPSAPMAETSSSFDEPSPTSSDGAAPTVPKQQDCAWEEILECSSRVAINDWCGDGFYAATLQRCSDLGAGLFSVNNGGNYGTFLLNGCPPACATDSMHVTWGNIECCPEGVPGTAVPEEPTEFDL
jgi:hypothetical protein